MFGVVVIVPEEGTFWFALRTAAVEAVKANATIVKTITDSLGIFVVFIGLNPIVNLNKHYSVTHKQKHEQISLPFTITGVVGQFSSV